MIELVNDSLVFRFPEVHPEAVMRVSFQRTLRIPDDDREYPLPPGLGTFPMRHVDDFARRVPGEWMERGGVMLPMYQSEAMWLYFSPGYVPDRRVEYPFAIKVAAGKVNAVTGEGWGPKLNRNPQDYLVAPEQPWLDGFCVEKGVIRQFVAMPLGDGYSAEEQLTGRAEHGGLQIIAFPMKREVFERRFRKRDRLFVASRCYMSVMGAAAPDMGLAPGGRMRQEIYDDPYGIEEWDERHYSRCFIHIANSEVWRSIAGEEPPTRAPTARDYARAGLPWFDYYDDELRAVEGARKLKGLKSVAAMSKQKRDEPLPENGGVDPARVVRLGRGRRSSQVREGRF